MLSRGLCLCSHTGSYQQALQHYKSIHTRFPESIECLKFLVRLTSDLGLKEAQEYSVLLKKAEKAAENKRQVRTTYCFAGKYSKDISEAFGM